MIRSPSSSTTSSACALSPPDTPSEGAPRKNEGFGKSYQHYLADHGSARSTYQAQRLRKQNDQQQQDYHVNNDWRSGSYDSSNTSWESDWSASRGGPIKSESPGTTAFYKYRNTTGSYQAGTDWSGDPPTYGVMQQSSSNSPSASSSSYYDSNDYYAGGYGYDQNARGTPTGYQPYGSMSQQQQQQQQQPYQSGSMSGSYNGNRNPSSCPPASGKPQDYQRRQTRYGMDNVFRTQIKPDPDGVEMEGENFTSLFTKSLTSLYSQDTENTFGEDSKTYDSDIMICNANSPMEEGGYQRLGPPPPGQYNSGYQNMRNNFGFYESRQSNCEPSVVQELGSGQERTNSFRYDRPSFDDMHLYASSPAEMKSQAKKRKLSMPNITQEGGNYTGGDNRRKAPRAMSFKSDAKWTPNSFAFGDVHIKQEPIDDYTSENLDSTNRGMMQFKDISSGNTNGNKNSGPSEHTKAPPRKRSPGSTCFDRFEKKSTPTSKKVSPLSVYAKVQDSVVLNVKCRRYKKRTKAITSKEEAVYPGKEDIENWKRTGAYSESPDQAVRHLMGDLMERVCQFSDRTVDTGPDLSQIDSMKVRELVFQFCQRYSLDYRDFEDIENVLRPNIVNDKTAKNSLRASAIRKRTSVSPATQKAAPEPETKPPKTEKVLKKSGNDAPRPAERRVLRSLPGRVDRGRQAKRRSGKTPVVRRRYSTRSAKDAEDTNHSDVDIIIDSSTDRESEAGKEAEVRKKSQRLKNKQPVETPAKENSKPPTKVSRNFKREEPRTRSREKKETEKIKDSAKAAPKKKWSRLHISNNENSQSSSGDSVEIISSSSSSPKLLGKETKICIKIEPLPPLKSLTMIKTTERTSKILKQNEESVSKSSKSAEDSGSKNAKQTEEPTNKSKDAEDPPKNSKLKDSCSKKATSKNDETPLNKITIRKLPQKSHPPNRKDHLIGRRAKTTVEQPITLDEDSSDSKDDVVSSSKPSDQKAKNISSKDSDMSSDESKDSVVESPKETSGDKTKFSSSNVSIKISKLKENESDISDTSSNNTNSSSNEPSESNRNEKISLKSESSEKSDLLKCRIQKFDKPIKFSLLNEKNEPTLQIKLNRLPLKLDSKKRFLPLEKQDFYCSMIKSKDISSPKKISEDKEEKDVDLQDPPKLVCMKDTPKEKPDEKSMEDTASPELPHLPPEEKTEPPPADLVPNVVVEPAAEVAEEAPSKSEIVSKPCPIVRPRYSESEDSDCGLVIDLDRRMSVEERVPSPTFQNVSNKKDDEKSETATVDLVVKKEPAVSPPAETKSPLVTNESKSQIDDDCILLPPSEDSLHLDSRSARFLESTAKSFSLLDSDLEHAKKMKDQEESILRTLLLETADVASGMGQDLLSNSSCDAAADISADSKASISQDVMKFLMYQTYHEVSRSSPGFDDKKIPIDQLPSDVSAQLLSDEECLHDPRLLKERIKKLKNEIVYLQCMIDQKDKERTAIICFKRYKEEVLKRVLKEYANNVHGHVRDWIRSRQDNNSSDSKSSSGKPAPAPIASTSSASSSHSSLPSDSPHPQLSPAHQVIQLAYHATVKTDVPTSTVTSASKKPPQSSESLPTVATMIAKATENYGVDMRTMRNSTSTTQTILQKVLSSKEAIYSPTTCRSPSSDRSSSGTSSTTHHQQQSVQIFQKTLSSTRESCFSPASRRSPSLPELRPGVSKSSTPTHPQLLHKALSSKDMSPTPSRSPPSLQPELRPTKSSNSPSSLIQKHPLDLIVNSADKLKSSSKSFEPVPASSSKSNHESNTKHSSSPKRSSSTSYSSWSSVHSRTSLSSTTTTTIDLRTDHTRTTQEPVSLSKRTHSSSHSSSGQGFMVVPPPTTLQQSQKSSVSHASRTDGGHPHEKSLKNSVERIYSRKTEEERRTMSFSSSVIASGSSLQFNHSHKSLPPSTTNNSNSVGSSKTMSQPPPLPPTSNPPRCMGCGISPAKFLCSGCRSHWYCSPECQTMRWPEHSQTCVGNISVYNQSPGPSYS